jgi:hypothetical protein
VLKEARVKAAKLVADAEERKQQQAQTQATAVADAEPANPLGEGSVNPLMGERTGESRPSSSTLTMIVHPYGRTCHCVP